MQSDRFEHAVNYTLSCTKRISVAELTKAIREVARRTSAYIKSADSNITNTKLFAINIGMNKHDTGLFMKTHVSYMVSTDKHIILKKFLTYSAAEEDSALAFLYDDDYVTKVTGMKLSQRQKIYKSANKPIDACCVAKVPPLLIEVSLSGVNNEDEDKEAVRAHTEELKGQFRRQCFKSLLGATIKKGLQEKELNDYLFSEWCLYN